MNKKVSKIIIALFICLSMTLSTLMSATSVFATENTQVNEESLKIDSYKLEQDTYEMNKGKSLEELSLPTMVTVTIAGQECMIPVTWDTSKVDVNVAGDYVVSAVLGEGYTCDSTPQITIKVIEESTTTNEPQEENQDTQKKDDQETQKEQQEQKVEQDNQKQQEQKVEESPKEVTPKAVEPKAAVIASPDGLKINGLSHPFGVNKADLKMTWKNNDASGSQKSYHIVIATTKTNFTNGIYAYSSGWVNSSKSSSIKTSPNLKDNRLYYWAVQVRNNKGGESALSQPQAFTTAVGGSWASKNATWGSNGQMFVFMRTNLSFDSSKQIEKVILSASATSSDEDRQYIYNFTVNGKAVGLGPVRRNQNSLYYQTFDITDKVNGSRDVLGTISYSNYQQAFLAQVTAYYTDGTSAIINNSGRDVSSWKCLDANNTYYNSAYKNTATPYYNTVPECINMNKYPKGWNLASYNPSWWSKPRSLGNIETINNHSFTLTPYETENMQRYDVASKKVTNNGNGVYTIDLGQEIVGSIRLNITTSGSKELTIEYGETLENGVAKYNQQSRCVYQEKWTTRNGYQSIEGIGMKTFRYVTIRNCPVGLSTGNVTGIAIRQPFDDDGAYFTSSNTIMNDIFNIASDTIKYATQDVYVDSQNRERLPYEGDNIVQSLTSYAMQNDYSVSKFTTEYLAKNGTWPAEYRLYNTMTIYNHYLYSGDMSLIQKYYYQLKGNLFESKYNGSLGLIARVDSGEMTTMIDHPDGEQDGYDMKNSYYNTAFNAICVGTYNDMAKMAQVLGDTTSYNYYTNLANNIRNNLISRLYNSQSGKFYDGLDSSGKIVYHSAQHATAYPLAYGVYNSQAMANAMANSIKNTGEIKTSVFGSYFLLQGLYDTNNGTIACKLMSDPSTEIGMRTYAYMIYNALATVTTESWGTMYKTSMSWEHAWGSGGGAALVRGMFGIKPETAGFSTFQIKIQPGGLRSAAVKTTTDKGKICASYTMQGNGDLSSSVTIPANTTAHVYIPTNQVSSTVTVNGNQQAANYNNGYFVLTLTGGQYTIVSPSAIYEDQSNYNLCKVAYNSYQQVNGWSGYTVNAFDSGVTGQSRTLEAMQMKIKNPTVNGGITYRSHRQTYGWGNWTSDGASTEGAGSGKRLEAFQAKLTGEMANQYDVYYRAHCQTYGWLDWAKNGVTAGTMGLSKRVESMQMVLVKKGESAPGSTAQPYRTGDGLVSYRTHVQTYGWQGYVKDGEVSGTSGQSKRLEGINISLGNSISGGITYQTHVQTYGWQGWVSNGAFSGTSGQSKRLEAIRIKLTGDAANNYNVYYRVHAQQYGWLDWAMNGQDAGTTACSYRLEAIQIMIVPKGSSAPGSTNRPFVTRSIAYQTHVQRDGWQGYKYDGQSAGTSGQSKRLEGMHISLANQQHSGGIQYRTHIQTYGWENGWRYNGEMTGTTGQSKRLEAIQIQLYGDMAKHYDVYYRVHCQQFGWLDWAKNGESSGSAGYSYRLEAIEIRLVAKGGPAPGNTGEPFKSR